MNDWPALIMSGVVTGLVFVAATIAGLGLTAYVLLKMPPNYFSRDPGKGFWEDKPAPVRFAGRLLRNVLAAALLLIGAALSLPGIPGPGLMMMLLGLTLLSFPGKRRIEQWLLGRPAALQAINRLRRRYGQPPVVL